MSAQDPSSVIRPARGAQRRWLLGAGLLLVLTALAWRWVAAPSHQRCQGRAMGCEWTLLTRERVISEGTLQAEMAGVLEHWEQVMSTWRWDSDLSRYQRGEVPTADLQRVLVLAEEMRRATAGAFDPRVGAAVQREGFAPPGGGIDLSAIGKGFAVDRVGERLRALGYRDFLFQLAGETLAGDEPWTVALESPDPQVREVSQTVTLCRQALATSGNYRQFHLGKAGEIRSHLIDPQSGEPVIREWSAVTVIANDATSADVWATACFVRGAKSAGAGMKVIWQPAR
jgi:thiamine biosynthesis lipoprotein